MIPILLQTFNRCEYTIEVISAIHNHILYPHKVIVIDNGSTDGTVEFLELAKKIGLIHHLILNKENLGIAVPKNQGLEVVKEWAKTEDIKFVVITDNDIVVPFIRKNGCILTQIVKMMEKNHNLGMVGVDLNRDNAPNGQEYWWKLRQHPANIPQFAEIVIGFWFAVIRYEYFKEFKFDGASLYGRVDESIRNWITINKKAKIGVFKGVEIIENGKHKECESRVGVHLGWSEDASKFPEYVTMKKQERFKAEQAWKADGRKW